MLDRADKIAAIIFYVLFTLFFLISITGKPKFGIFFMVPLFPLQNVLEKFHQFPLGNNFIDILLIGIVIGWFISCSNQKKPVFIKTPINKMIFFMIIFSYFSLWNGSFFLGMPAPFSPADPRVQFWKNYMIFPLLFFLVVNNIDNKKDIKILVSLLGVSILISGYYTFRQISWMSGLVSREKLRGTFVWLGPNEVAAFFAVYSFVFWGIFTQVKKKFYRFFSLGVFVLSIYCVLFLFSRGSYLAVLMGFIFIAITKQKKLIIPLIMVLMFWQTVLPIEVVERINQTHTEEGTLDASSQGRINMWEKSIDLFQQNFLVGVGLNVFPYMGYSLGDTHNVYFKILAEQGLIGIFIILMIFYLAITQGWALYSKSDDLFLKGLGFGFVASVFSLITTNIFGDRWTYSQIGSFFWVLLGLVVSSNVLISKNNNEKKLRLIKGDSIDEDFTS